MDTGTLANHLKWVALTVLAAVFLYSAAIKLADPQAFHRDIMNYRIIDGRAAVLTALWLPWLQLTLALALWFPWLRRGACLWLLCLLAGFSIAFISAWWRDIDINCGCFGSSAEPTSLFYFLARNSVLMGFAAFCYDLGSKHITDSRSP